MYAAQQSKLRSTEETVKNLLKYGADVNVQDNCGITAITYAFNYSLRFSKKVLKYLLDNNANLQLKGKYDNPITFAFNKSDNLQVINILLPTRKHFIKEVPINTTKIMKNKSKFWRVKSCDFKIMHLPI